MGKAVLQTRCVGMAPDASGHALAPPEIVYECEEPRREDFSMRLFELLGSVASLAFFAFLIWKVIEKAVG